MSTASKVLLNSIQVFTHRKQVLCTAGKVVYRKQVSDYCKQGFVYRQLVCDYCKQGFTYLHPAFTYRKQAIMYRRQGFIYRKQVSDYKVLHTSV